jgi:hypothetical protein
VSGRIWSKLISKNVDKIAVNLETPVYTDEDLKWDKPLRGLPFLIHLSVTVALGRNK